MDMHTINKCNSIGSPHMYTVCIRSLWLFSTVSWKQHWKCFSDRLQQCDYRQHAGRSPITFPDDLRANPPLLVCPLPAEGCDLMLQSSIMNLHLLYWLPCLLYIKWHPVYGYTAVHLKTYTIIKTDHEHECFSDAWTWTSVSCTTLSTCVSTVR